MILSSMHVDESADDQEETGWKYIHGVVFCFLKHKSLFAAALGSGAQLVALIVFIFVLALVGVFSPYNRGSLFTALVVMYAFLALRDIHQPHYTASLKELIGQVRNLLLTDCLFCGPLFLTFSFLNTVAIFYSSTLKIIVEELCDISVENEEKADVDADA